MVKCVFKYKMHKGKIYRVYMRLYVTNGYLLNNNLAIQG